MVWKLPLPMNSKKQKLSVKIGKKVFFFPEKRLFSPDDFTALPECAILTKLEMIYVNKNDTKTAFAAYYRPKKNSMKCEGALWHNM